MAASREAELYRGFPFHPFHPPPPEGKGFGDRYGNGLDLRHLQPESMRRSAGGPSERLAVRESPYLDSRPFGHESFPGNVPRIDRGGGEREWQRRDRTPLVNGDYHHGMGQLFIQCTTITGLLFGISLREAQMKKIEEN